MKKILILGNVSSGKSTFINSFLKHSILPTSNLICTSKEIEIKINNKSKFPKYKYNLKKFLPIKSNDFIRNIMETSKQKKIKLTAPSLHKNLNNIILFDSPGVNNSIDKKHKEITMNIFNKNQFFKIFLILNAENICTIDDEILLKDLEKFNSEKEINIIINKIDKILLSDNDSLEELKLNVIKFLAKNKIEKYNINFYSSIYFELIKNKKLDKKLQRQLNTLEEFIGKNKFLTMKSKILKNII